MVKTKKFGKKEKRPKLKPKRFGDEGKKQVSIGLVKDEENSLQSKVPPTKTDKHARDCHRHYMINKCASGFGNVRCLKNRKLNWLVKKKGM